MRLKSLEIQGFKSFPDKTTFVFGNGLTAIVGPNGSGKSNISDAVRWVLGEQSTKTLRGERMEDVIFSGTQARKSLGFAQVSLYIDNTNRSLSYDSDEVVITRKYYRSGESEYMINMQTVRLSDVRELFMDTGLGRDGYSVVGQGKIANIVSAKSTERRMIFEEAAGISKFRHKKNQAERSLEKAQENILRLKDILSELEGRVEPLRIQSEKAKKYLVLAEEKLKTEVSLWVKTLNQSTEKLRDLEYKLTALNESRDVIMTELNDVEFVINKVDRESQEYLKQIEEQRSHKQANEEAVSLFNQQKAVFNNDIEHNKSLITTIEQDIDSNAISKSNIDIEIENLNVKKDELNTKLEELSNESKNIDEELSKLTGITENYQSELDVLKSELVSCNIQITRDTVAVSAIKNNKEEINQRILTIDTAIEQKENQLSDLQKENHACKAVLEKSLEESKKIENILSGYEIKYQSIVAQKDEIKAKIDSKNLEIHQTEQKQKLVSELEENMEGFSGSVKRVISDGKKGALRGIVGTVSQLISVESKYAVAIETALGAAMQNVVVETEENAKHAIYFLKKNNAGRATFLPINTIKGKTLSETNMQSCEGFVGVANELVKCDNKLNEIIRSLLGRIVICDNLDNATNIAKKYSYRFKIVTLDGQVINAGGSLTGGSIGSKTGVLSRKFEIEKLENDKVKLLAEIDELTSKYNQICEQASAAEAYLSGSKAELSVLTEDKIKYTAEQKRLATLIEDAENSLDSLDNEKIECRARLTDFDNKIKEIEKALEDNKLKKEQNEEKITALSGGQSDIAGKVDSLSSKSTELKFEILSIQKDIDNIGIDALRLEGQKTDASAKNDELIKQKEQLLAQNEELSAKILELEENIASKIQENQNSDVLISEFVAKRAECDQKIDSIRKNERSQFDERERLTTEITRLEERVIAIKKEQDSITFKLFTEYEMDKAKAEEIAEPIENVSEYQSKLSQLKSKIKALGNINVSAIEEYAEVSERYEFLSAQLSDVEKARNEIIKLISELTSQMKEMFNKSFEEIKNNFSKIFVELFGGGKATLSLTDPNDVLESGIEIFVQPPGKIIKNLMELSGGEQSFVAIAIYLSILKVKPAPFCILDEIEAALDEVNVQKYAKYLRKISDKTQFIMITHRRGSMEEADALYGITMQEKGVSKLLELKLSEVESKLGIKSES